MPDSLDRTIHLLFHTAREVVLESPDPEAEALELNQAAVNAGAAVELFPGEPSKVVHDTMTGDLMAEYLTDQEVLYGRPPPSLEQMNQVESLADLRTLLLI